MVRFDDAIDTAVQVVAAVASDIDATLVRDVTGAITVVLPDGALAADDWDPLAAKLGQALGRPGSFELPLAARRLAESGRYHAIICLGAVIRGETSHFDYVAGEAARGIARVNAETGIPTIFGVITADTVEQALERAGGKVGNKGYDATVTAIEMANLMRQLEEA